MAHFLPECMQEVCKKWNVWKTADTARGREPRTFSLCLIQVLTPSTMSDINQWCNLELLFLFEANGINLAMILTPLLIWKWVRFQQKLKLSTFDFHFWASASLVAWQALIENVRSVPARFVCRFARSESTLEEFSSTKQSLHMPGLEEMCSACLNYKWRVCRTCEAM